MVNLTYFGVVLTLLPNKKSSIFLAKVLAHTPPYTKMYARHHRKIKTLMALEHPKFLITFR